MTKLALDKAPLEYSQEYDQKFVDAVEANMPHRYVKFPYVRIEFNADTGRIPLFTAKYPCVVRVITLWTPITVDPNPVYYTLIDIRNHGPNGNKTLLERRRISTNDGFKRDTKKHVVINSEEGVRCGSDMFIRHGQTVVFEYEHYFDGTALAPFDPTEDPPQDPPDEVGAQLVDMYAQVTVEKA